MKLKELAQLCEAKLEGNGDHEVIDVAVLSKAKREHLCFITDKKYLPELEQGRPGAVIAPPGMALPQGVNALRVADPDYAFSKALTALRGEPLKPMPGIAEHVIMGSGFEMGDNTSVGAFTYIGADVKLGRNVIIYPHCYIGDSVTIGDDTVVFPHVSILERCTVGKRCVLQPGARIGGDGFGFHFVNGKFIKAPQRGTVVIEDDVEIGANTTVDRARFDVTIIRKGTKIDNLVQVAHNVQIGQNCVIAGLAGIAGSAVLKDYVQMGGNSGIADHITVGMGAKIAAKTGIMNDIEPGMKIAGLVGDDAKVWMRREASVRKLPELIQEFKDLKALVAKLAGQVGLPPEPESEELPETPPGQVTRFLRNRPAPDA
ncbi:MAG: UDP-3-O-(3-hydroxymyristoyl)glucosamine N-acyltransferase [Planctomycetes bacterium]|nr:UDP-3-O-(3-hydroxymyristoyl)glucosamine N-acyltransferase [Planctomycetota bacterium]MCW8135910.1 UDP-3-O-(3-hydroxymyristoyl)glucosamine N-acyltransferase [Planctomycetota bacterium]